MLLLCLPVAASHVGCAWQVHPSWRITAIAPSRRGLPVAYQAGDDDGRSQAAANGLTRINKALRATHSRRASDQLIAQGRVRVNGVVAEPGTRLVRGDRVQLDGAFVDWERLNPMEPSSAEAASTYAYLKLWKARGVVCTTDQRQRNNIIDSLGAIPGVQDRIYPIGRLDADSSGLILLTSDGGIVNQLLRSSERKSKEYVVTTDVRASDAQIARLARGVTITTVAQRDGRSKPLTAPTKPCVVERIATGHDECRLRFVLQEGRNRQIRRMCEACGLQVVRLHRVGFAGITLRGCQQPGDYAFLTEAEIELCRQGAQDGGRHVPAGEREGLRRDFEHELARKPGRDFGRDFGRSAGRGTGRGRGRGTPLGRTDVPSGMGELRTQRGQRRSGRGDGNSGARGGLGRRGEFGGRRARRARQAECSLAPWRSLTSLVSDANAARRAQDLYVREKLSHGPGR